MKKLILLTCSIATMSLGVLAQKAENKNPMPKRFYAANKVEKSKTGLGKTNINNWYNHLSFAENSDIAGNLKGYVSFLRHDSLAKYIGADGVTSYGQGWISFGAVLDPKDAIIDLKLDPINRLSKFNSYKLDSLRFTYLYVRNVDTKIDGLGNSVPVVDTLYICYFKGAAIKKFTLQNTTKDKLALVDWNKSVRFPLTPFKVDTILLTASDSTFAVTSTTGVPEGSFKNKVMQVAAPSTMTVNANGGSNDNNLIAATFIFKSAIPTINQNGDTAVMIYQKDPSTLPVGTPRANYFGFYYLSNDQGNWTNPTHYNTTLLAPKWAAYQPTANGWDGYLSGNAFVSDLFVDVDFLVSTTSDNISVKEVPNSFSLGNAFPNPSSNDVTIAFDLKSNNNVSIKLVNLVGQEVMNIANDNFSAGANEVKFNVSNLTGGVYFYTMTVDGVSQSQKIMIK